MSDKQLKGRLRLILVDVYGKLITDRVVVKLKHRELSDKLTTKEFDTVGKPFVIEDLRQAPKGNYILKVIPTAYRPWAQYVNVMNRTTTEMITLHIRSNKAVPSFPTYKQIKKLNPGLIGVLERSDAVKGQPARTGERLWNGMKPLQKAAVLNIGAKAIVDTTLQKGQGILPHIELREVQQDRCLVDVPEALVRQVQAQTGIDSKKNPFKKAPGGMHEPPENYERSTSHKTREKFGNLQFTFFAGPANAYLADIDIDNSAGIRHLVDVIEHKVRDEKTHPYDIHEILVNYQRLDPGYTLAPKKT